MLAQQVHPVQHACGMPRVWRSQVLPMRSRPSCRCCRSRRSRAPRSARAGAAPSAYTFCQAAPARARARSGKAGQPWAASTATVRTAVLRQLRAAGTTCTAFQTPVTHGCAGWLGGTFWGGQVNLGSSTLFCLEAVLGQDPIPESLHCRQIDAKTVL